MNKKPNLWDKLELIGRKEFGLSDDMYMYSADLKGNGIAHVKFAEKHEGKFITDKSVEGYVKYEGDEIKEGDIVIGRSKHSCDIRFVEGADETGILLVNGIKDKYYEPCEFDLFHEEYKLLVRKENREDLQADRQGW